MAAKAIRRGQSTSGQSTVVKGIQGDPAGTAGRRAALAEWKGPPGGPPTGRCPLPCASRRRQRSLRAPLSCPVMKRRNTAPKPNPCDAQRLLPFDKRQPLIRGKGFQPLELLKLGKEMHHTPAAIQLRLPQSAKNPWCSRLIALGRSRSLVSPNLHVRVQFSARQAQQV